MGERLDIGDRMSVRTPMQWTDGRNGGFSNAPPRKLPLPLVDDGYGPAHVNVSDQRHDRDSMLHFTRRLIERYRSSPEMGWGAFELLTHDAEAVLAHSLTGAEGRMIALHNFSGKPVTVSVRLKDVTDEDALVDLLVDNEVVELDGRGGATFQLDGYGYRWYRVLRSSGKRLG